MKMKLTFLLLLALLLPIWGWAIIDEDSDGLSDLWEEQHGFSLEDNGTTFPDQAPNADPDLDGLTNVQEWQAGTDPWNYASDLSLTLEPIPQSQILRVRFGTVQWKRYQLQSKSDITLSTWTNVGGPVLGKGLEVIVTTTLPPVGTPAFFRLQGLEDPDVDGDLLTTWEEHELETDPNIADTDADGLSDGISFSFGFNPSNSNSMGDDDDDGLDNLSETLLGWDAENPDTDGNSIPDGEEDLGFTPGAPSEGSSSAPDVQLQSGPPREPVNPTDSDDDGWSDTDDSAPNDPSSGASITVSVDFAATSNQQFESWRPTVTETVSNRTYIYRISGVVNYQNTSAGHDKDYAFVLDQGPLREDALHWNVPVTFLDVNDGQPASDHTYFVAQTGNGAQQQVRPRDVNSGDLWSPGGGGPNGVADSYEDNSGSLAVEVIRPSLEVIEHASYENQWRPLEPGAEPQWQSFSGGNIFRGDDIKVELDLGDSALNDAVTSATWEMTTQEGPAPTTLSGTAVPGQPRQGQFININPVGRVRIVATVSLNGGQQIVVDDYFEIPVRTQSITAVQWINGPAIQPVESLAETALWVYCKISPEGFPFGGVIVCEQLNQKSSNYALAAVEWLLKSAPDVVPLNGGAFAQPQQIPTFLTDPESKFRLGNTFRLKFHPKKNGGGWVLGSTESPSAPAWVQMGKTRPPEAVETLARWLRLLWLAEMVLQGEVHPTDFGALRKNSNSGNERIRLSGVVRLGAFGQEIQDFLFETDVPWLYSNITFDASRADGTPVEEPQITLFPTASIYTDGQPTVIPQGPVIQLLDTVGQPPPPIDP
jgi:hypothetical protein